MKYTAFETDEYDKKIRQTLPYYEDFYKQILDILTVLGKEDTGKNNKYEDGIFCFPDMKTGKR